MSNCMKDHELNELLLKYHSGKITRKEFLLLTNEVNCSSDDRLQTLLHAHWDAFGDDQSLSDEKIDQLYANLQKKIKPSVIVRLKRYWMPVAASLLILLVSTWTVLLYTKSLEIQQLKEQNVTICSGHTGYSSIVLPDGTTVRLNAKSSLSYQQDFGQRDRKVKLIGEGYFEVQHDAEKQFTVSAGDLNITVLGTTFNVYAYENKNFIEMSLINGSVQVSTETPPYKKIQVRPNEKVVYDKLTGKMDLHSTTNQKETAWLYKELNFRHEKLKDVLDCLERKFGIIFQVSETGILEDTYTGFFDDENIQGILQVLKLHYGFHYEQKEDTIYISMEK